MASELLVGDPIVRQMGKASRAIASVNWADAWFESEDIPPRPSSEGFASAFLLAAAPVRETAHRWWGYHRLWAAVDTRPVATGPQRGEPTRSLYFTGGVDPFSALLVPGGPIRYHIHAHGSDARLVDKPQGAAMRARSQRVAESTFARLVTIRTNLRTLLLSLRCLGPARMLARLPPSGICVPAQSTRS